MAAVNTRRARSIALRTLVAGALLAACSSESEGGGSTTTTSSTVAATTTSSTTSIAPESTTTTVAATTTTTLAPTTTAGATTTTTVSPAVGELALREDGIGSAAFGAEPEGVIAYVSALLGSPSNDTGWIAADTFAACAGEEVRQVVWGTLTLLFGDVSTVSDGRRHFYAYDYGLAGVLGDEPVGLVTPEGIGLGTRIVDLEAAYPGVIVSEGDGGFTPPNFYVNDNLRGLITGSGADDVVTVIFGGIGCGE